MARSLKFMTELFLLFSLFPFFSLFAELCFIFKLGLDVPLNCKREFKRQSFANFVRIFIVLFHHLTPAQNTLHIWFARKHKAVTIHRAPPTFFLFFECCLFPSFSSFADTVIGTGAIYFISQHSCFASVCDVIEDCDSDNDQFWALLKVHTELCEKLLMRSWWTILMFGFCGLDLFVVSLKRSVWKLN